jgi:hypothetical protein
MGYKIFLIQIGRSSILLEYYEARYTKKRNAKTSYRE